MPKLAYPFHRLNEPAGPMPDDPPSPGSERSRPALDHELADRAEGFRRAARRAEALTGNLTPRQMEWRPEPDRWSVAECLEHLVRTGEVYLRLLDRVIGEAREEGVLGEGPFRHGLLDRWLVRLLEPPPGLRINAPRIIDPRKPFRAGDGGGDDEPGRGSAGDHGGTGAGDDPSTAAGGGRAGGSDDSPLPRFVALQDRLTRRLEDADGVALDEVRVRSPFVPLVRMDLGTAFTVIAAHQRRHLWQAEQVAAEEGFPAT